MNSKEVIYIVKEAIHMYPPCITQILTLNDQGVKVTVLCGDCSPYLIEMFKERKIKCYIIGNKRVKYKRIGKIMSYLNFRNKAWGIIQELKNENTVLWFGTVDGAIAMTNKYKKMTYILTVLELYDQNSFYRNGLSRIITGASAVIACEENRARIMKVWWNLNKKPYVMPNKPYTHPNSARQIATSKEIEIAINKIKDKKVVLYQGIISGDRDLHVLAEALKEINLNYTLVLLGKKLHEGVEKIQEIYSNTIYLGYIPAPQHLEITSYAHIGIASYDDSSLNNLFCAPNKIYEYSGFGIPILGSEVPGLTSTIGQSKAGECVDFTNREAIIRALEKIEMNYNEYKINAKKFYEKVDNTSTIDTIIRSI